MRHDSHDSGGISDYPPGAPPPPPMEPARDGLSWERREELGIGTAMLQTIREVLFSPSEAFARMKQEGGWSEPLQFAVVVGSIFIWVAQAWGLLTRSLLVGFPGLEVQDIAAANAQEIWLALMAPFLVVVITFLFAAAIHGVLLILGGGPHGFEATFRVVSYCWAAGVFSLLPICGGIIGGVWRVVVQIIGVREAQQVPTGRAAAAVLIPVGTCLCFVAILFFVVLLGAAGLAAMGMQ